MKIHKGDTIKIMVGKDAGKTGKVLRVYVDVNKVLLENLNLVKKHRRPRKQGEKGEIISVARPVSAANVMLVCKNCGKPVRAGYKIEKTVPAKARAVKTRICKKCQNQI